MALAAENTQATSIQNRDVDIAVGPAGAREDAEQIGYLLLEIGRY